MRACIVGGVAFILASGERWESVDVDTLSKLTAFNGDGGRFSGFCCGTMGGERNLGDGLRLLMFFVAGIVDALAAPLEGAVVGRMGASLRKTGLGVDLGGEGFLAPPGTALA